MQGHDLLLRSRLKVRQLATLIAIADAGSLRGAAAVLRVSQPALSKTVRELEAVFDRALFVRESRGLRQTSHGTAVIDYARRLLRDVDALTAVLAAVDSGAGGRLRIGAIPYVSAEWLRAALERMLGAQPPVAIQLVEGATDRLVGSLRNRELDCVIGRVTPAIAGEDLETRLLFKQTLRVIVRSGHPLLRKGKSLQLAHLGGCEWILSPATTPTRQLLDRSFVQAGLPAPRARLETYALPIIQSFLSGGDALAALPNDIAQQCVRGGGFRALPFAWEMPPVFLVWLKRDEGNVLVQRFGEAAGLGRNVA